MARSLAECTLLKAPYCPLPAFYNSHPQRIACSESVSPLVPECLLSSQCGSGVWRSGMEYSTRGQEQTLEHFRQWRWPAFCYFERLPPPLASPQTSPTHPPLLGSASCLFGLALAGVARREGESRGAQDFLWIEAASRMLPLSPRPAATRTIG